MYRIRKKRLTEILDRWNSRLDVYAPQEKFGEVELGLYDKNTFSLNYINFSMPLKEYIYEVKEELFSWNRDSKGNVKITTSENQKQETKRLFFGIRNCDTYGIAYFDKFFMGEFEDINYRKRRENTYIVAMNCLKAGPNCFCSSQKTGAPFETLGHDISLTPMDDYYLMESATGKGQELIGLVIDLVEAIRDKTTKSIERGHKSEVLKKALETFETKIDLSNIHEVLSKTYNSEIWKDASKGCIGCTGCTNVCPTCTCFQVVEENTSENSGKRVRYWDSCQSLGFTLNAGDHNTRDEVSKTRYRIYDKLMYIEQRFGFKGCTGCGRCAPTCPTAISIVDIVNRLNAEVKNPKIDTDKFLVEIHKNKYEIYNRFVSNEKGIYVPEVATILDIIDEGKDMKRFKIQIDNPRIRNAYVFKGQFFEISVFGVGEIAISIPYGPGETAELDFAIKKVGSVTKHLHENMKVGDKIGLRGPFGKAFPYEEIKGRDIIVIGSGVGLAPVRTMLAQIFENKSDFGKVVIIASGKSYDSVIYKEDLKKWSQLDDVKVLYALAEPTDEVDFHAGYINDLLPTLDLDWNNTTSVLCASPSRIKKVAVDLQALGVSNHDILVTLETHMRCGAGKCGHCKVGSHYMCVDGPVFSYHQMLQMPPEY